MNRYLAKAYFKARMLNTRMVRLIWAVFNGFWIGILTEKALNTVDDLFYTGKGNLLYSPIDYTSRTWNTSGLFPWEESMVSTYFPKGSPIAVLGAGGGREVLALARSGFTVDGWECQQLFVDSANELLAEEGFPPTVSFAPRNECGRGRDKYDGIVFGWGAYTLVHKRPTRVELLRAMRERMSDGSPLLLSFHVREGDNTRYKIVKGVANTIRRLTLREPVELGDMLDPLRTHRFTAREIRSEMEEGGFALEVYYPEPFGHAVGRAVPVAVNS